MADNSDSIKEEDPPKEKRPQFRNRILSNESDVFQHNTWDNIAWDEEQQKIACEKVDENSVITASEEMLLKYEKDADKYWNNFYSTHGNKFFQDRNWLLIEFPELANKMTKENVDHHVKAILTNSNDVNEEENKETLDLSSTREIKMLEIGCGVGNTVFPILSHNIDKNVFVYCCDFSIKAIEILQQNPAYDATRCKAFVLDVTQEKWETPFEVGSLDIVILIFTLSAISPDKMEHVVKQIHHYLKPGGLVLFRDYGRYDLAQLRFKLGNCIGDNFYVRGDGTKVYFFTEDDIRNIFTNNGFIEEQNFMDKRLQINRLKKIKMYRVWVQGKFRKVI